MLSCTKKDWLTWEPASELAATKAQLTGSAQMSPLALYQLGTPTSSVKFAEHDVATAAWWGICVQASIETSKRERARDWCCCSKAQLMIVQSVLLCTPDIWPRAETAAPDVWSWCSCVAAHSADTKLMDAVAGFKADTFPAIAQGAMFRMVCADDEADGPFEGINRPAWGCLSRLWKMFAKVCGDGNVVSGVLP